MAEIARTIFAPLADEAVAIQMSVYPEGDIPQCSFTGRAASEANPTVAIKCVSSGWIDEEVVARFLAAGYLVSSFVGRNISFAFAEFDLVPC